MATEISGLDVQDLSARVKAGQSVKELRPVGERLNELLGRLEAAFERERAFSADVAHELRTPLAGLRSTIDVILSKSREPAEYIEALKDSQQITVSMHAMVENLLTLARLEAGQVQIQKESVNLHELMRSTWQPFEEQAASRCLQVEWTPIPEVYVSTDSSLLRLAVRNAFENAVLYANEGGEIKIAVEPADDTVSIHVTNTGSSLPQEQAAHAFARFWRGDAARSAAGVHCGLGLSLVDRIVSALDGSAEVESADGGPFTLAIIIPRG
jgi:two-component system sensor histidine kinase QseC